ncbi:RNA-directed DNA polymerase [Salipiger mucosus]|nr:RNA-directed DNA polymerase [Salipiger mucosus]
MQRIIDLDAEAARAYLIRPECYFRSDFPSYISFAQILQDVDNVLGDRAYTALQKPTPERASDLSGVNYEIISTKDGRFGWRTFELIHPAIYVTLLNALCDPDNWKLLQNRFTSLHSNTVECTSHLIVPQDGDGHDETQILNWWLRHEQRSLELSLEYTHVLKTDVTNCYGSLYTHSIPWALHGFEESKADHSDKLIGNTIDRHIRNGRHGQTNGITQGSVLMDLIAELVLAYVDHEISQRLGHENDFHILRYRDDYSVFTQSDRRAAEIVRVISDCLRRVGMQLGAAKTSENTNIVEATIKPEKLAGIQLENMDITQAKTVQKQLLRLHAFARRHPNSGALNRLSDSAFQRISKLAETPKDLRVQVAIVCDIAVISPRTFPALSGIIAKLISLASTAEQSDLWSKVQKKMQRVPHNGQQEIWLQRVTRAKGVGLNFDSTEPICQIVAGESTQLWNNDWITDPALISALDVRKIVVGSPEDLEAVPDPAELSLFRKYAEFS